MEQKWCFICWDGDFCHLYDRNDEETKSGAILAVDGNPLLGSGKDEFEPDEKKGEMDAIVKKAIEDEAKVAIEAIMIMEIDWFN